MPVLYDAIKNSILNVGFSALEPAEIMAIIYGVSVGNAWYCSCSSIDRARLDKLPLGVSSDKRVFLKCFEVQSGINKGKMPAFEFKPFRYAQIRATPEYGHMSFFAQIALACSWGMVMKSAYLLTLGESESEIMPALMRYNASQALQIETLIRDFNELLPSVQGDFTEACVRYGIANLWDNCERFAEKAKVLSTQFELRGCV
jgi:hypothetical protein